MVVARGSEEPKGAGVTGEIADRIAARVPGSQVVAVDYPASMDQYSRSEGDGADAVDKLLGAFRQACPSGKAALFGYSQGAQVAMDSICGGAGDPFNSDKPVSSDILRDNVVAVVLLGDPTHIANQTYDRGTSKNNGLFQRNDTSACAAYTDKIRSYCDAGDIYCDRGSNRSAHHQYIAKYGDEMTAWVVRKFEAAAGPDPDPGSGSGSGSNATPSASRTSSSSSSSSATASPSVSPPLVPNAASGLAPAVSSLMFGAALLAVSGML